MGSLGGGVGRRFAVLLCAEDSEYVRERYGGYFGVFKAMLADESDGETWDLYRAAAGELPSDAKAELYDGFVITGSCSDAHGDDLWILQLLSFVKKIDSMKKKILGVCFGHQMKVSNFCRPRPLHKRPPPPIMSLMIRKCSTADAIYRPLKITTVENIELHAFAILSRAIGGKVSRAKSWDIGLRTIQLSSTSMHFSCLNLPTLLSIIECHRDEVKELPPKAEVIARSNKTRIEIFRYGNHIMGIQGHPEYTKDILLQLIDRLLQRNFITNPYAEELKVSVGTCEPDREAWRRLCISFLKGGSGSTIL